VESKKEVVIIGCGPGGAGYLTGQARDAVDRSEVVIGTAKFLSLFPRAAAQIELDSVNTGRVSEIVTGTDALKVAVLVSGDTGLYSLASSLSKALPQSYSVKFIPGVSCIQAACALFSLEWQDMRFFSLHYRPATPEMVEEVIRGTHPVAFLCGPASRPGQIAGDLIKKVEPHRVCYVACKLGSDNQRAWQGKLVELVEENFNGQAVCIIDRRTV